MFADAGATDYNPHFLCVNSSGASMKSASSYMTRIPATHRDVIADGALVPRDMLDGSKTYADFVKARALLLSEKAQSLVKVGSL